MPIGYNNPIYQSISLGLEEIRTTLNLQDLKITLVLRSDQMTQDIIMTDDDLKEVIATLMRDDESIMQ